MKTIRATETFNTWFAGLRDKQAAARIQVRIDRAEDDNFGDCAPVVIKPPRPKTLKPRLKLLERFRRSTCEP